MKVSFVLLGAALTLTSLAAEPLHAGDKPKEQKLDKKLDGYWVGPIKLGPVELRVVAKFTKKKDGTLGGTLDSPDQGAKDIPIDEVTFKDPDLRFEVKSVKGVFEGKFKEDGTELVGRWKQGNLDVPLTLKRQDKPLVIVRPQEPKRPYPYLDEEVSYENKKAKVKFAGTLTLPKGKGPFPAVLLITGSGPQNRDEELLGHKPFLILADHLTRQGIAVLRVDDRGVGGSTGDTMQSTTADFAEDALAGVAYLKGRKEINPKQIGLLGHSEGGVVAPLAASQSKDIAFIVLLAGTGLVGEEILRMQTQLILKVNGADEKTRTVQKSLLDLMLKLVKQEKDNAAALKAFDKLWPEIVAKLGDDQKKVDKVEALAKKQFEGFLSPWFRHFIAHDPRLALRKVACPVLALNGELDLQVPAKENLAAIGKALKEAGNKDVTLKEFPSLNHLFQTCKTGSPTEYASIEETMAPVVLRTISEWILKRTTTEKQ
ncbi:MAG TPA: alpha/beta fold hydrolase [Gemmataceae bacterium]|nr:alpha/beta fold hydrolase [Gemmataceae bacterium]